MCVKSITSCSLQSHDLVSYAVQYSFLALSLPVFQFLPQSSVVLLFSSSLTFSPSPTVFVHSFSWSFPRLSMASLFSCRLSQLNHSYYLTHTSLSCSTALPFFHFPIMLNQVFLLKYLAFSLVKHNFPKSYLDSPFGIFFPPSVCFRSLQPVSFYHILKSRW